MGYIVDANKKFQKELNSGTAALVLLSVLDRAKESMYGYQIAKMIETKNDAVPMMKQGALYPVLRSLENSGLLESRAKSFFTLRQFGCTLMHLFCKAPVPEQKQEHNAGRQSANQQSPF